MQENNEKTNKLQDMLNQFKELLETNKEKKYKIKNLELFKKAVTIDGRDYRDFDLNVLVKNYTKLKRKGFRIPLIFGHEYEESERLGYVSNLKLKNDSLYGDFVDLKEETYNKFKEDVYNGWSIEFANNINDENGNNICSEIMRVAALSSSIPAFPFLNSIEISKLKYDFSHASLVTCNYNKKLIKEEVVNMENLTLEKHNFEVEKLTANHKKEIEELKAQMEKEVFSFKEKYNTQLKTVMNDLETFKAREQENNINSAFEDWTKMQILKESDRENFKLLFSDDKYTKLDVLKQLANVVKTNVQARNGNFEMFTQEVTRNNNDLFVQNNEVETQNSDEFSDKVVAEMIEAGELSPDFVRKF